ncbi:PilW family protein [Scleromatobacter humisilvae]|uniref:PilW family protein n=1 Tax=Scleromatobacter humisilvae TaxID=2897159 RepID=A0A9X2C162_9BURK|nr:PilW family protein [Scleromatobacter humisilvae]MCK9688503.1 PilW family protein [Scleromatobacter humisilvae]
MNTPPILRSRRAPRRAVAGFTLVELMVALLLSLLLAVAILKMQTKTASQSVRIADTGTRDTQARAAMDLITHDITGSGFLFGNLMHTCEALVTYNSGGPGYFAHHPVDAVSAVSGSKMKFAPSITLNYPAGAVSAVQTDVLVTMAPSGTTQFTKPDNTVFRGDTATGANPLSTGIAPTKPTTGFTAGDTAIMQTPLGGALPCLRVPISSFTSTTLTSSGGTIMPSGGYSGFVTPMANAGFSTALTNVGIFNSWVTDIGTAATSTQQFAVYYIDGSGSFPVLMRAVYSLADDTVVTAPQPIAAGVVSLRVSFGVDPGLTGAVTAYEESATVTSSKHWSSVRSVRVALVTRTINDDPNVDNAGVTGPTTIPIGPVSSAWFTSLSVPASKHRYIVNTTEVGYRNWLWKY